MMKKKRSPAAPNPFKLPKAKIVKPSPAYLESLVRVMSGGATKEEKEKLFWAVLVSTLSPVTYCAED